jgi:hypothetical protein
VGFSSSRTAFFGNGYGVEFIVTDPFTITFNIITEKDETLVANTSTIVGTDYCLRRTDRHQPHDETEGEEESMRDFAVRARLEGIAFAEEAIAEHKLSLELSSVLDAVLEPDLK